MADGKWCLHYVGSVGAHVMENAVKYRIFVKDANSFATERTLEALLTNYLAFLNPLIDDFIWQYEPFCLFTKDSEGL